MINGNYPIKVKLGLFPSPRYLTYLLCNLAWVPAHSPWAEGNTALGDGSLEQPFVMGRQSLCSNTFIDVKYVLVVAFICINFPPSVSGKCVK